MRTHLITGLALAGLALALQATSAVAEPDLAQQAAEAIQGRRYAEAREAYRTLAVRNPDDPDPQVWVARLSSWMKDYSTAEQSYDLVLSQRPDYVDALVGKAYLLTWQDRFDDAEVLLERARAAKPDSNEVEMGLARLYRSEGRERSALKHVEIVLERDPGNVDALELQTTLESRIAEQSVFTRLKRFLTGTS
jgi:tetratricopeptide (TPR) repeat protein